MRLLRILPCLFLILALAACSRSFQRMDEFVSGPSEYPSRSGFVEANYRAADTMAEVLEDELEDGDGVVITDFVNLGDPSLESTLSRLIPDQISSKLAQHGFRPVSQRHSGIEAVQAAAAGKARLVGSYTTTHDRLFINARVIRTADSAVIAGYDYELPANPTLRTLVPGAWRDGGIEPTVRTSFTTAARQ